MVKTATRYDFPFQRNLCLKFRLAPWGSVVVSASLAIRIDMVRMSRLSHPSVLTCELWQNGWSDPDAVWRSEWGRALYGCIRFWWWSSKGKGQFGGENNVEMAYWSIIDSCVKDDSISVRTVLRWILCRIPFLMIQSGSRSKWGWREFHVQKCTKTNATPTATVAITVCRAAAICTT